MGVPALTWSPDFTKILVIWPSTWGLMAAEWRDLRMARYSLLSEIFCAWTTCTCTGMACMAGPAGPAGPFWQAASASSDNVSHRADFRRTGLDRIGVPLPGIVEGFSVKCRKVYATIRASTSRGCGSLLRRSVALFVTYDFSSSLGVF